MNIKQAVLSDMGKRMTGVGEDDTTMFFLEVK